MTYSKMTCEQLQAELEAIKAGIDGLEDDQEIMDETTREVYLKICDIIMSQRALLVLGLVAENAGLVKFDSGRYGILQMAAGFEPETVADARAFLDVFYRLDEFNNKAKKLESLIKDFFEGLRDA